MTAHSYFLFHTSYFCPICYTKNSVGFGVIFKFRCYEHTKGGEHSTATECAYALNPFFNSWTRPAWRDLLESTPMSTRKRYVLAGLAAVALISVSLVMLDRSGNRKYDDLKNRMAAENAAQDAARAKELDEAKRSHDADMQWLCTAADAAITELAKATLGALNEVSLDAEAKLRAANESWEQRLADQKAESDAQHAQDAARIAAVENELANQPDLAKIRQDAEYITQLHVCGREDVSFLFWKFRIEGDIGGLTGIVLENDSGDTHQYILTAGHLKSDTMLLKEIWCVFRDDLNLPSEKVEIAGYNRSRDLCLLRFRKGFVFPGKTARLGDSNNIRPGEKIAVLGCPLDAQFTITSGEMMDNEYVGRSKGSAQPLLQVQSAHTTFGNSGGALVLQRTGEVIGVNVMLEDAPGGYFLSTPINDFKAIATRLKNAHGGEVIDWNLEHVAFEDTWRTLPFDEADIGAPIPKTRGVVVMEVQKDSNTDKFGLKAGDFVLSWNGTTPKNTADLWRMIMISTPSPTGTGTMKVLRGGKELTLALKLDKFNGKVFVHRRFKITLLTDESKQ